MNLTPLDIRKQTFKQVMRGYNTDEVNAFLEMVADEYETLVRKQDDLKAKLKESQNRLNGYMKIDRDIRDTMIMVNKLQESTKAEATRDADLIIQDAEKEAEKLVGSHRHQQQTLMMQVEQLKADRQSLELKLKAMNKAMQRLIDLETESSDELKLDLAALADADEKTLLKDRMSLLQDVRRLQKEKQAYVTRLKNLIDMQQQMLEM